MSKLDKAVLATALTCCAIVALLIGQSVRMTGRTPVRNAPLPPQIVFSTIDENGFEQLFLLPLDLTSASKIAGPPRQITDLPFGVWDFEVASTPAAVYFSALKEDGTADLWHYAADTEALTQLLACPDAACADPAVGPEGALLAFTRRNANEFSSPLTSPPRLHLLAKAEGTAYPIFADSQKLGLEPRWSGDGLWLSYASPDPVGVGAYQLESGQEAFFASTTGEGGVWRPGVQQLVISDMVERDERFETHLFRYDLASGGQLNLSEHEFPVEDNGPTWAPDGEWLAFRRKELAGPRESLSKQLWRMRADGSDAAPLTHDTAPEAEIDYGQPHFSPDGRYLVYHRFPLRGPDITISVWLMELESGKQWRLVEPGQRPQWLQ